MRTYRLSTLFLLLVLSGFAAFGQATGNANITKADLPPAEINRIIKKFTQNEALFRQALNVYAFNRYATIYSIGMGGEITGTYKRDSWLTFSEAGERFEKILNAPIPTLKDFGVSAEDIEKLGGVDPFAIEPKMVDQYNFTYLGKETIDELSLYVFDVSPKVVPDPKKGLGKYFQGRIWVEDDGLMIVKSKGKGVPEGKQRFPIIETVRAPIDNKYYFPVDSRADDELDFDGHIAKIRVRVKYSDYKLGRTDVKIVSEEDVVDESVKPAPTPAPKKP